MKIVSYFTIFLLLPFSLLGKDNILNQTAVHLEGKKAPFFTLKDNNNRFFFLRKKLKRTDKTYLVLSFFTTYCKSCKKERQLLQKLSKKYRANTDIVYIAIREGDGETISEFRTKAKNIMKQEQLKKILLDQYGIVFKKYHAKEVPYLAIINTKNRRIIKELKGYHADLEKIYQKLMNKNR